MYQDICIKGSLSDGVLEQAARDRARAIFEDEIHLSDHFNRDRSGQERWVPKPFSLTPGKFIDAARRRPPSDPQPTVSSFASWIYSLYKATDPDPESLREGIAAEKAIFEKHRRAKIARSVMTASDPKHLARPDGTWRLFHNGLNLCGTGNESATILIDHLHVAGCPLRASPDLAFIKEGTGEVIVVEVKFSRKRIPTNLWPNVWAQLWCYSQLPAAINAPNITVIGEVWGGRTERVFTDYNPKEGICLGRHILKRRTANMAMVYLRHSVRRNPRSPVFHRFFSTLFNIYRGVDSG